MYKRSKKGPMEGKFRLGRGSTHRDVAGGPRDRLLLINPPELKAEGCLSSRSTSPSGFLKEQDRSPPVVSLDPIIGEMFCSRQIATQTRE